MRDAFHECQASVLTKPLAFRLVFLLFTALTLFGLIDVVVEDGLK